MIRLRLIAVIAAAAFATAPAARAQEQQPVINPHGHLDDACTVCHSVDGWKPAHVNTSFKHAPKRFPLEGAHARTKCLACHSSLEFKNVSDQCAACHQDVHRGELGADCGRCHTARNFLDRSVMIQLHQTTRFPLTGAHLMVDCQACHAPVAQGHLSFVNRPTQCAACHAAAYATATPPHQANGFSTDCEQCHITVAWSRTAFDHASTSFPLTGAHRALACSGCHADGMYKGKPALCSSCHLNDYNTAMTPPHLSLSIAQTCADCHSTAAWSPAHFNHTKLAQPLVCINCHAFDYNSTNNPSHVAAQFPNTCGDCHATTTWAGATFNHDASFFPIYSGSHKGRWSTCGQCHTNTTNFALFSCLICHLQPATDQRHSGKSGYKYDSNACYACHPRGGGG